MQTAIKEAAEGMRNGEGGPFGAVIVKDSQIIARGHNMVLSENDSTAHAEMVVIRKACKKLGTYDLTGAGIYTTCEPCPMCLGAILWSRIDSLFFGCTRVDAQQIGFDDSRFYNILCASESFPGRMEAKAFREDCLVLFDEWSKIEKRRMY